MEVKNRTEKKEKSNILKKKNKTVGSTKLLWLNFKFDFDLLGGQRYLLPFV